MHFVEVGRHTKKRIARRRRLGNRRDQVQRLGLLTEGVMLRHDQALRATMILHFDKAIIRHRRSRWKIDVHLQRLSESAGEKLIRQKRRTRCRSHFGPLGVFRHPLNSGP